MKHRYITILILLSSYCCFGQNLIDNWTFEQGLQLYCADWYDGCGNELTNNCDTIPDCFVAFDRESPSAIPEEQWSLRMRAGLGVEGKAETFITGQSGYKVYELTYFMKSPDWTSRVLMGTYSDGKFTDSTYLDTTALDWSEFSIRDTLSTTEDDTIAIILSAGFGDFCVCTANFDLIRLEVLDTLTNTTSPERDRRKIDVYPNPAVENIRFEIKGTVQAPYTVDLFDRSGQIVRKKTATSPVINMDVGMLPSGLYFYRISKDRHDLGRGKFIVD